MNRIRIVAALGVVLMLLGSTGGNAAHADAAGDKARLDKQLQETQATLDLYGPGDVRVAHSLDEFVPLDEVRSVATVVARVIANWCGIE